MRRDATPKVGPRLLETHLGIPADSVEIRAVVEATRAQLAAYPERQEVLDGRASVRVRQLTRLRDVLRRTDRGARFVVEGMMFDSHGRPKPEFDFEALEARIEQTIHDLEHDPGSKRQRPTEVARDYTARELAVLFKEHYRLQPKDHREHLDAFLRSLFHANRIAYPEPYDDFKQRDAFLRRIGAI